MSALVWIVPLVASINGLGHWRGAQNFENTAYNSAPLAWMTGGESLHNNHHAHPRAPQFSARFGEFDPSWLLIRALVAVGLVTIARPAASARADMQRRVVRVNGEVPGDAVFTGASSEDIVEG